MLIISPPFQGWTSLLYMLQVESLERSEKCLTRIPEYDRLPNYKKNMAGRPAVRETLFREPKVQGTRHWVGVSKLSGKRTAAGRISGEV